jgi:integrase
MYRLTFRRAGGQITANYHYDFSRHPLRSLLAHYLIDGAEEFAGGSLNHKFRCMKLLGQFLLKTGVGDLTPEIFLSFIRWLSETKKPDGTNKYGVSTVASVVNYARMFYESGLQQQYAGWNQRDLDLMTATAGKALRGRYRRSIQESFDKAISHSSFSALAKAVALEFAQCRRVMAERTANQRRSLHDLEAIGMKRIDPNPFVVFAIQAALRLGLRASEFNSLRREDIRIDALHGNHEIYVHAPDKADAYIPVDETFLAAFNMCEAWSEEARTLARPTTAQTFKDVLLVYPDLWNRHWPCKLRKFNTYRLNSTHLPYFYAKWFHHLVKDEDGNERPLLHADGDPTRPFSEDHRKLRSAFAVRFAERERNRVLTAQVMRHESVYTAERYYLHQTRLDHSKKVREGSVGPLSRDEVASD